MTNMIILAFSGISILSSSIETIMPIIDLEKPDIVLILGDLFTNKNNLEHSIRSILELNFAQCPILLTPNSHDLTFSRAIKKIKSQLGFHIRWIYDIGSINNNWLFTGICHQNENENYPKLVKFDKMAPDRFVIAITGIQLIYLPLIPTLTLVTSQVFSQSLKGFVVKVEHLKDNKITLVDLDTKLYKSINL